MTDNLNWHERRKEPRRIQDRLNQYALLMLSKKLLADREAPVFDLHEGEILSLEELMEGALGDVLLPSPFAGDPPMSACGGGVCEYEDGHWTLCSIHRRETQGELQ
jgi:hypothetical protein